MIRSIGSGIVCAAVLAAGGRSAAAAYVMTPMSGGASTIQVMPGDSFALDIMLTSDASDVHNSAIFRAVFSAPGLLYEGYSWSSPYETGSIFDDSSPFIDDLAVLLDEQSLSGTGYPDGVVDFELSNVVAGGGVFGEGLLASLTFIVPDDFALGSVFIDLAPDTIANGFDEIFTAAGSTFELVVIPAPAGFVILLIPGLAGGRRRRLV